MRKNLMVVAWMAAMFSAVQADATVYSFSYSVGTGAASGTITTDGSIGVLSAANIVDWNIFLDGNPGDTFTITGPLSGNNSAKLLSGDVLSATATDLIFDFSGLGYFLLQNPYTGSSQNFVCFAGSIVCGNFSSSINVSTSVFGVNTLAMSGLQSIATTTVAAVPEANTLAMMGLGLGLMGLVSRRKFS